MKQSVALTASNRQLLTEVVRGVLNDRINGAVKDIAEKMQILKGLSKKDGGSAFRATTVQIDVGFNAMINDGSMTSFVSIKQVAKIGRRGKLSIRKIQSGVGNP